MASSVDSTADSVDVDGLRTVLDRENVVFAVLFGSHARGEATDRSDVDIAIQFSPELDAVDRFRCRNRIDATLQAHADGFVDVSDLASLPTGVAYAALRDGTVLTGEETAVESHRSELEAETETDNTDATAFIDRLARGDT
ncbi:MAG: putative nucleotidyltransferase [halophilic archaeon J07HB67]|jgi:Nucleotidyltransferase domain.|nr:MAG: putative nucleotidyltransferase [halophilic archaeon J07HB67]